ncbi:hypothetical protein BKA82DRAFT_1003555 [Pisolithus tinctorius]|uniref:Uncharacterized protein n=1 Tax=Pisolithus tinctorius Marx 270 TaxID=870435 RepID=A0A0C3JTS9_PISTI|nr:hypothetical protein BKA82DRAFT_1003555 [Pisolithus tinctorius]KIO00852.1 hypothetical protein M404DRAFT_1003555 [Pisolithus tinctorius Marx 270]
MPSLRTLSLCSVSCSTSQNLIIRPCNSWTKAPVTDRVRFSSKDSSVAQGWPVHFTIHEFHISRSRFHSMTECSLAALADCKAELDEDCGLTPLLEDKDFVSPSLQ